MKLSFAMMVKNEERHLDRCMHSIRDIADEIVILDTGSTDRTLEIAGRYTDKIFHEEWADNFALHRNTSFSHATGDWIFQIDADEELFFFGGNKPKILKEFLDQVPTQINAICLPLKDIRQGKIIAELDVVRIFRRGQVKYKRRIHNEPIFKGDAGIFNLGGLNHYGYDLTPEQKAAKAKRTIGLLELSLKENPKDYESLFYLAQAYSSFAGDEERAHEYALEYLKYRGKLGRRFNQSIYFMIATQYLRWEQFDKCQKMIDKGLDHNPQNLDLAMCQLKLGLAQKNSVLAAAGAGRFVNVFDSFNKSRYQNPGTFLFNYNLEAFTFALYYLSMCQFEFGTDNLKRLQKTLAQAPAHVKTEIHGNIDKIFKELGIQHKEFDPPRIIMAA
jgi:glycosyltransferase involved in cell wall biosynthesis